MDLRLFFGLTHLDVSLHNFPHDYGMILGVKVQSTPVISRLLGSKIRERELSGSPVISRCRAKAPTRKFRITDPHSQAFTTLKQYVER